MHDIPTSPVARTSSRRSCITDAIANTSGVIREPIPPHLLGSATVNPDGVIEAGSWTSLTLVYTVGAYGIDDSGSLRICFRFASDQIAPQFDDPIGPNYTTIEASNCAALEYRFDRKGNVRPWDKTLYIKVSRGYLLQGETITVRFGVTDHGGPGIRMQTFCEENHEFRVLVDPVATFNYQPLPVQPSIRIVPGPPSRYVATLPSRRRVGEEFSLHVKGEDRWGNPSDQCDRSFRLRATAEIEGLPNEIRLKPGSKFLRIHGLRVARPGDIEVTLIDEDDEIVCAANPLEIVKEGTPLYWADLHGQSEETIGTGSAEEYFTFARDLAPVDAVSHQGNDFQITREFWSHLDHLTELFEKPGEFLAVPGYEWSGNTGLGGDRNVFFPETGRRIRRSSHALIEDRSDADTDVHTACDLFEAFAANGEWDVVCYAHCGGRYADIRAAHDGRFEKSIEIHSSWGTFEWLLNDAFDLGYRVGIVANSDGHKGRPGASYPGASMFGAVGGLTCLWMPELTRSALFDCLRKRRHYATTGGPTGRPIIDLSVRFKEEAEIYHDDPALGLATGVPACTAMMGDIVHLPSGQAKLFVKIRSASPIERLDIFNGRELVETIRPYGEKDLGSRVRCIWEGAEYRGRFRETIWDGSLEITDNAAVEARPINFFNPNRPFELDGTDRLRWKALTTGNIGGFDLWLKNSRGGALSVKTPLVDARVALVDIGFHDLVIDCSGDLPRSLKLMRLPDQLDCLSVEIEREVELRSDRDNPIFLRLRQEDGVVAWTSPIYIFR